MRLPTNDYGLDSKLPENETESTIENSEKMFAILSDHIYKDKILAMIRELICNAYDAHVDAGKRDVPIRLRLPNAIDPTFWVEDDGTGLDPEVLPKVYLTYGRSTKTNSNETIGALGLGSKSPFAYTKSSFIVRNRWDGVEYSYLVFINSRGKPAISLLGQAETDRPNGLRAECAVKPRDIHTFLDRADRFLKYWKNTMPELVDHDAASILTSKIEKVIDGKGWYLEDRDNYADFKGALAVMGNIPYPIEVDAIPNMPEELKVIAQNSFVIDFGLGTLAFQPSREALSFDEFTVKNLTERLEEVRSGMSHAFIDAVFAPNQTQVQFRHNFHESFFKFTNAIRAETTHDGDNTLGLNTWALKILLNLTADDTVSYNGRDHVINDLLNQSLKVTVNDHQPFCLAYARSRSNGVRYLSSTTELVITLTQDVNALDVFDNQAATSVIKAGRDYQLEWTNPNFPVRKNLKDHNLQQRLLLTGKVAVRTVNRLIIDHPEVIFVVSDEGGVGEAKLKSFLNSGHAAPATYYFIKGIPNKADPLEVIKSVGDFIKTHGLDGAKIEVTSNLDDYRPAKDRVKRDKTQVKLSSLSFTWSPLENDECSLYGRTVRVGAANLPSQHAKHHHHMFELADLRDGTWLYVLKDRTRTGIYEPSVTPGSSYGSTWITKRKKYMEIALTLGMLDDVRREEVEPDYYEYPVLALTKPQVDELTKKGVKLTGVEVHVNAKVDAACATRDYVTEVTADIADDALATAKWIYSKLNADQRRALLTTVTPEGDSNESVFISQLRRVDRSRSTTNRLDESYMMAYLSGHTPRSDSDDDEELLDRYPLLRWMPRSTQIYLVLDYLAAVDNGFITPAVETLPRVKDANAETETAEPSLVEFMIAA